MITEFGKYIRKLRIDNTITLRSMADAMGMSASYLSSVETGKRNITTKYFSAVVAYFQLTGSQVTELQELADISRNEISLSLRKANRGQRNSAIVFARRLNTLTSDELGRLDAILLNEKKGLINYGKKKRE